MGSGACEGDGPAGDCGTCIEQGWVEGLAEDSTCSYLGIPYAKPPVGEARFTAPEPAEGWSGVRKATEFSAACEQGMSFGSIANLAGDTGMSEDCLYINVWTPSKEPENPLPVMVYVYGGGYTSGSTSTYIGKGISEAGDVVVVSMNYRVGALAFFATPELDAERGDKPAGSDGIRDQQLALQWVQDNIEAFHGDPSNVTIFGESAGSSAVGIHLVSPGSKGMINRYIMESGVPLHGVRNGVAPLTRQEMYDRTAELVADLCSGKTDVLGCLRDLAPEDIIAWSPADATSDVGWAPVIEGKGGVLPNSPDKLIASGKINEGEVIVGTNKNEYGLFALIGTSASTVDEMRSLVEMSFPDAVDDIMAVYEADAAASASQAYITMMTDIMFRCDTRRFARQVSAQGRDVYLYSFEQGTAWHSDELAYIFGDGNFTLAVSAPLASLSDAMRGYWLNFAHNGDPNGDGLTKWPKYTEASDKNMTLVDPPAVATGLQKESCDFWDDYLANH